MSIRLKLAIMFLAIATAPLLFVSDLTFTNYKRSLEANRFAQLQDLTIFRADKIEVYFAGLKAHIEIAQDFYNIKKNLPIMTRLADDHGNQEFLDAKKMLDAQLQQMQSVSGLSDVMLVNPQGRVVYSIRPGHFLKDMSKGVDAEQKAFTEGKSRVYFSDVYFDKVEDNRFETLLAAPATDFNGAFIGVIAFEIDMTPVYNLIQDTTGLGKTGEVLVARKIGNQAEFLNPLRHDPNAALKRTVTLGENSSYPVQEAVQGRTGSGQAIDYRGKKVIAAWRYIPSLDWGLVAKIDTKEAFADVTNLRNLAAVILVIIIVLSGIMAFSIAHSISEPIKRLSEGAAIIGSGNLDYKLGNNLKDEIGQLSRSFDKMTLDLKQTTASRDELNREITERKKAEEELRQSEIKYRTVADNTYDWEFWLDPEGHFIYCSPSCERITGHRPEEFLADPGLRSGLIHPDDRPQFEKHLREIEHKQKGIAEGEWRHVRPDGTCCWVAHVCQPVFDDSGRFIGIRGSNRDITERKRAEEELRKSRDELEIRVKERTADLDETVTELQKQVQQRIRAEEAFRSASLYARGLLEASLDPLVTISPEGKITDVNKATEAVTGISRERLIGSDFSNYFTEPDKARDGYKKVLSDGLVIDYPLTIRHTSGRITDVLYNATVYKNEAGQIQGVFAAARDITEKKAAEAELEKYRLHLEDLVKNRTEELARSNKDLEQFAYVASHDLQEPLRAVSGFVELLKRNLEKSLDEKTSEYMNFTIDGAKRMQSLINGLLEYSRVGTQGKKPQKVNSKEAFEEALVRLQAGIEESGARITADKLPMVYFDDMQLARLFQNLIGNAIKFRSDQAPQIHVSAVRQDAGWRFAVRDNGIGIEPQYAERIFMIFQRLHTRKTYAGTGIGLSICKKIVERHGGRIWVESTPGRGSTFYFTVPDIEGAQNA